ncbi:MAG TPA: hypothetical protein VFB68_01135 [Xanthobacteraceae bacterium]|nr:hypothetical protein [Xanthobacteraceae bacterium]
MLANNFMSPSALGLSDVEFESLVKVLGMLERGEIGDDQFTMRRVQHPCRTPACLCGWANHVSGGRAFPLETKPGFMVFSKSTSGPRWGSMSRPVQELFGYGGRATDPVYLATPPQAATALRSFLTHGEACWAEALAD